MVRKEDEVTKVKNKAREKQARKYYMAIGFLSFFLIIRYMKS